MRTFLILPALAASIAAHAATVVTVQDILPVPLGGLSGQGVYGTIDNTNGSAPIIADTLSISIPNSSPFTFGQFDFTSAGTFDMSSSNPLAVGQSYTGLLGYIVGVRNVVGNAGVFAVSARAYTAAGGGTVVAEGISNQVSYGAVPEPSTVAAMGLGAAALIRRRRR